MAKLGSDPFARRDGAAGTMAKGGRASMLVFVFVSLALLVLSRFDNAGVGRARETFNDLVAPIMNYASKPALRLQRVRTQLKSYIGLFAQMESLKLENQRLRQWEWRAKQMEATLANYRKLVNGVPELGFGFATGRVISDGRGPFVRSLTINLGQRHGLRPGFACVSADGVVGRIVDVGRKGARVLLLTDLNSRIPVLIGDQAKRAVMVGDNTSRPSLSFLGRDRSLKAGDEVYTSGDGGLFPRGLRIGVVEVRGKVARVRPYAKLNELSYISVLFYAGPSVSAAEELDAAAGGRATALRMKK